MTLADDKDFHRQDKYLYDIKKNKNLLQWIKKAINNGYHLYIDIDEIQDMINKITCWYEFKYPEHEFECEEGIIHANFKNIKNLSQEMNFKQLCYRLFNKQLCLMECNYRSVGGSSKPIYNELGEIIDFKSFIHIPIKNKITNYESSIQSSPSGIIENNNKNITLDQLLILLKENNNNLDLKRLEECIFDHNCDLDLRNQIFQLVALKLIYSNNTSAEYGYKRAKLFTNEMNKNLNLNLNTIEMDNIVSNFCSFTNTKENKNNKQKNNVINYNFKNN